jgi:hypothetical protein
MKKLLVLAMCSLPLACGSTDNSHDAAVDRPANIADVLISADVPVWGDTADSAPVADAPVVPDLGAADRASGPDASVADAAADSAAAIVADGGGEAGTVAADGGNDAGMTALDAGREASTVGLDAGGEAGAAPVATRLVLIAAPGTIIAAAYEDTVILGQLQDDAGNPVLTNVEQSAAIKATLSSSNSLVMLPYYPATDDRGQLIFDKLGNPNWAHTYFKATSTPGSATISGTAPGLTVVPVTVTTVAQGGAATALRVFAQPARVPAGGTRGWFPVIQIVDGAGAPTYRTTSFDVTIASDNAAVSPGGSVYLQNSFDHVMATISVPGTPGTAMLTASAAGLAPGTATLTVLP